MNGSFQIHELILMKAQEIYIIPVELSDKEENFCLITFQNNKVPVPHLV